MKYENLQSETRQYIWNEFGVDLDFFQIEYILERVAEDYDDLETATWFELHGDIRNTFEVYKEAILPPCTYEPDERPVKHGITPHYH